MRLQRLLIFTGILALCATQQNVAVSNGIVVEIQYTTIDYPVTVWVDQDGKPLGTSAQGAPYTGVPTIPISSAAYSSPVQIPTVAASSIPAAAPSQSLSTVTMQPTAIAASVPTSSAIQTISTVIMQASATANCEGKANACVGDVTHWEGGLGACGWNVDTSSNLQIALPVGLMGSQSNGNPYCGRSLTIQNPTTGKTIQAKVGDKCMGCTGRSIDLTDALFQAIASECNGRCSGFVWWFN